MQGGLILRPWVPTLVLQKPVQAFEHSRSEPIYKVPILRPRGANPKNLGANGGFTKACSDVCLGADGVFTKACSGF